MNKIFKKLFLPAVMFFVLSNFSFLNGQARGLPDVGTLQGYVTDINDVQDNQRINAGNLTTYLNDAWRCFWNNQIQDNNWTPNHAQKRIEAFNILKALINNLDKMPVGQAGNPSKIKAAFLVQDQARARALARGSHIVVAQAIQMALRVLGLVDVGQRGQAGLHIDASEAVRKSAVETLKTLVENMDKITADQIYGVGFLPAFQGVNVRNDIVYSALGCLRKAFEVVENNDEKKEAISLYNNYLINWLLNMNNDQVFSQNQDHQNELKLNIFKNFVPQAGQDNQNVNAEKALISKITYFFLNKIIKEYFAQNKIVQFETIFKNLGEILNYGFTVNGVNAYGGTIPYAQMSVKTNFLKYPGITLEKFYLTMKQYNENKDVKNLKTIVRKILFLWGKEKILPDTVLN